MRNSDMRDLYGCDARAGQPDTDLTTATIHELIMGLAQTEYRLRYSVQNSGEEPTVGALAGRERAIVAELRGRGASLTTARLHVGAPAQELGAGNPMNVQVDVPTAVLT